MDWMGTYPYLVRMVEELRKRGVDLELDHFYGPIPRTAELDGDHFSRVSELPGIDERIEAQLAWVPLWLAWEAELRALPRGPLEDPQRFTHANDFFNHGCANVLYAVLRHLKPARMIEVGSGHSTLLSAQALALNATEGSPCVFEAFEPYPGSHLLGGIPGLSGLAPLRAQEIPMEAFLALGAGDVLFIDSSHVLKTGSDVHRLYLEVIPRLNPGVWVHVHDIFLPWDYPRDWVLQDHRFWTEQYLLQAFLAFNRAWQIEWCGSCLKARTPDRVNPLFAGPGSLWMRRVAP